MLQRDSQIPFITTNLNPQGTGKTRRKIQRKPWNEQFSELAEYNRLMLKNFGIKENICK